MSILIKEKNKNKKDIYAMNKVHRKITKLKKNELKMY